MTLTKLSAASDTAVISMLGSVLDRDVDLGTADGDGRAGDGVSVMSYEGEVLETVRGNVVDPIVVSGPDTGAISSTEVTPQRAGEGSLMAALTQCRRVVLPEYLSHMDTCLPDAPELILHT